jgi:hypothetical protein
VDIRLNPNAVIRKQSYGSENLPLLVIDDFVTDPDTLVRHAAGRLFTERWRWFPGVRTRAPLSWRRIVGEDLRELLFDFFGLRGRSAVFRMCHYSLITTPAEQLAIPQRIPHYDSLGRDGLASIHYLFRAPHGGTAFYRHRRTGFEYIDPSRHDEYHRILEQEVVGPDAPPPAYIDGDTPLFERIHAEEGLFNRILFYRRHALHSGSIGKDFVPDPNPLAGRLSINSFIDAGP